MTVNECTRLLRENDDFLIVTHARPDGDTLCSAAALCSALRRSGKQARLFPNPEITDNYMPFVGEFLGEGRRAGEYVVSVDLANDNMLPKSFEGKVELSIDHHASNSGYAAHTLLDAEMAACVEIILGLIHELCGELSLREAELLYVAIATDCGCFCFGNTTARTLTDAAELLALGVNNAELNKTFFRSHTRARIALEGMIYSSLKSYRDGAINVVVISREMMRASGATENDCDDLASLPGRVRGNIVAITVRELAPGRSKASVRTNSQVDASAICSRFGGGGHFMAAGCTAEMDPYELAGRLVETAGAYLK